MGYTEPEKKDFSTPSGPKAPKYPYGLRITLNSEEMKKLGFNDAPDMDQVFELKGSAKVIEVANTEEQGDVASYRVELQIVELELSGSKEEESNEQTLYGG